MPTYKKLADFAVFNFKKWENNISKMKWNIIWKILKL
jgi:hypothetical protein